MNQTTKKQIHSTLRKERDWIYCNTFNNYNMRTFKVKYIVESMDHYYRFINLLNNKPVLMTLTTYTTFENMLLHSLY